MVNYKTITDTGPITFSPYMLRQQQGWLHGPTATREKTNKPPGGPPLKNSEQSPPSFFEQGNRIRWLLLFLPLIFNKYFYGQFSPHGLTENQFCKFYLLSFFCTVIITHFALNAKRRTLANHLHDCDDTPYQLSLTEQAYDKWYNTSTVPLFCILTGFTKAYDPSPPHHVTLLIATILIFLVIFYTNNYEHTYKAIYRIPPEPHDDRHIKPEGRNMLVYLGTLAITLLYVYDAMVDAGMLDGDND
jgi:hypothetical protein